MIGWAVAVGEFFWAEQLFGGVALSDKENGALLKTLSIITIITIINRIIDVLHKRK